VSVHVAWQAEGWTGWVDPGASDVVGMCLGVAARGDGRASRHARTARVETPTAALFVKTYAAPGGWRALRAFRMAEALTAAGFGAPPVLLAARRAGAGLLVMRDAGGEDLLAALERRGASPALKRTLLRGLGREVARLHAAGFVHGDLVPPNVLVREHGFVFLDNDRTRRSRFLVRLAGHRNLVQLGRLVVPGVTATDRARVLVAYARERGLSRRTRRRLGHWVMRKVMARRCAIDAIPPALASRAGFRELMRSGGPFDPARRERRAEERRIPVA
jgi:hypothetical protein